MPRPSNAGRKRLTKPPEICRARRPIRITAFSENLSFRTPAIFSGFSDLHPEVQFDFLPAVKALDLCAGEADIALRLCWRPPDPDLICRKISNAQFTLYGSPDYAARHGLPETPKDMPGHAILSYRRDDMPDTFHNWLTGYVQPDQICRSFSEVGLLRAAIHAGHGLGIMNLRLVSEEEAAGSLVRCFEPPEELCVPHVLLVSPQAYRRPRGQGLREILRAALRRSVQVRRGIGTDVIPT